MKIWCQFSVKLVFIWCKCILGAHLVPKKGKIFNSLFTLFEHQIYSSYTPIPVLHHFDTSLTPNMHFFSTSKLFSLFLDNVHGNINYDTFGFMVIL